MPHYPQESCVRQDISDRVKCLREKLDIKQAELARWLGVSRSYVTHLEKGRPCSYPVQKLIERIERDAAINIRSNTAPCAATPAGSASGTLPPAATSALDQLKTMLTTRSTKSANSDSSAANDEPHTHTIPLLSMTQACSLHEADDAEKLTREHVSFSVRDSHAFAVRVRGDSMQPQHIDGEVAIVYPSDRPHVGDRVLARLEDGNGGTVLFRIFNVTDRGKGILLSSPNPAYPVLQYRQEDFEWIHPVAATLRQLRD